MGLGQPVAAGIVAEAGNYRWSSARSHLAGTRADDDPLTNLGALGRHVHNWRAMQRDGLEAMDSPEAVEAIEAAHRPPARRSRLDREDRGAYRSQAGTVKARP